MGRWAQQSRRGGYSGGSSPTCIHTLSAVQIDDQVVRFTFASNVAAGALDPGEFHTHPADTTGTTAAQGPAANIVDITFDDIIGTPQTWNTNSPGGGLCDEQSGVITV